MIGYVLRYYPTWSETFVQREIDGLRAAGVPVDVVSLGRRDDPVPALPAGAGAREVARGAGLLAAAWRGRGERVGAEQGWKHRIRLRDAVAWGRARGWRRVHAHFAGEAAVFARDLAGALGVPWSVTVHAADLFKPIPGFTELLSNADQVVTICEHHRVALAARGVAAVVVRCGVPLGSTPVVRPGPADRLRVVAVGRYTAKKGLDVLRTAVIAAPFASLRLVSDAPAAWAHPRVVVGPLPPHDVPTALADADLFALPCRVAPDGDRDGVPVALIEAMAAGLPVVSTPVSGIPELVDPSVGWLVPPDDPAALVSVFEAARDPARRAERGAAGRARVASGWSVEAQVAGIRAVFGV